MAFKSRIAIRWGLMTIAGLGLCLTMPPAVAAAEVPLVEAV